MKLKQGVCLLLIILLCVLAGCGGGQTEEEGYKVYYVSATGTRLMEVTYELSAQTFEELMDELLTALATPTSGYQSALAGDVTIQGYERGIDALRIDFSQEYYELSNIQEVLLRAAVVKTLCQIPGVTKIMITVEKEQLKDADGNLVPAMDSNSFIDTKEGGINSYLYATLFLYFSDSSGTDLVMEERNLHYSSNMVLERVVLEQLIAGPQESGAKALFSTNVHILNLYIQDGVCTINLDSEANKTPADSAITPRMVLQAVVNSICETCDGITGVRFEIEGDNSGLFRSEVDLNQLFTPSSEEETLALETESGEDAGKSGQDTEKETQQTEEAGGNKEEEHAAEEQQQEAEEQTDQTASSDETGGQEPADSSSETDIEVSTPEQIAPEEVDLPQSGWKPEQEGASP